MDLIKKLRAQISVLYRKLIVKKATRYLGTDASPDDIVDDVVGCAESVTTILAECIPSFPIIVGTWTLYDHLNRSPNWVRVYDPQPGDVLVSPTGMGNGKIRGHTGILSERGVIMSNDSYSGKWMANYTVESWKKRYVVLGGIPMYYFRYHF